VVEKWEYECNILVMMGVEAGVLRIAGLPVRTWRYPAKLSGGYSCGFVYAFIQNVDA
jgi:hypothetical protein